MSELQISAAQLPLWLCFDAADENGYPSITIECNFCSREGFMFYAGAATGQRDSDWITKAVVHITEQHEGKLPE